MACSLNGMSNFGNYNSYNYEFLKLNLTTSDEAKLKISIALTGRKLTEEHKRKLKLNNKGMRGKTHSEETKKLMSVAKSNMSLETKKKMSDAHLGCLASNESKLKMSIAHKGKSKPKVQCPHCDKIGGLPQMKQWHFDRCKFKF